MGNIREKIGYFMLRRKLKTGKRKKEVINLEEAKKVGIVFNATDEIVFELIKKFSKSLVSKGIEVYSIGFVDQDKLIDHYLYRKGFIFFTKKQINWYMKPVNEEIESFIRKEFDILIDLTLQENFPLKYIVALSKAKFKVGRLIEGDYIHDMMIDINKEIKIQKEIRMEVNSNNHNDNQKRPYNKLVDKKVTDELSLHFLIEQTQHYLSRINKDFVTLS